ncbi:MAG: hypothetical protein JSV56_00265 [Methanomassiliicoccales archaeon]|nr:MAG: hypothetical protein JSV56_00265 [Methanomassiliicoccales archaeon]
MRNHQNRLCTLSISIILTLSNIPLSITITDLASGGKYGDIVPTTYDLQLLDKINENRTDNSAVTLKFNATLSWVARAHSQDMIDYDFFDHTSSVDGQFNGATFQERVNDYAEYENSYIGETIAYKTWGIDVEGVMSSWKNSPPHWDIIIDSNFREVGIGLLEGEWDGYPNAGLHTAVFGGEAISVDLTINDGDIEFEPSSPKEGQEVNITATIHNIGTTDAYPVYVKFFDGDPDTGGLQIGDEVQIPHILVQQESATVNVFWSTIGKEGNHDIYVVIDDNNYISEGNEDNNTGFKSLVVEESNQPIHLTKGWNLVSFPYIESETGLDYILNSINSKYDRVQTYNSSDPLRDWKHYLLSKPPSMNTLTDLDHKTGFWIHITDINGADLILYGDTPSSPTQISLRKGWNLVGYPSTTKRTRDDALNNLVFDNEIDAVQYHNNITKTILDLDEGDYMEPGNGYWLHATEDCNWIINN